MSTIYEFSPRNLENQEQSLSLYKGSVLLIVNTASKCGFTPQYEGLQRLYDALHDRGFEVLGFPCNQFAHQEPGTADEIRAFCTDRFHVTFPMFAKIDVNGPNTAPLYQHLKQEQPGVLGTTAIKWNFTKFLIDRTGRVIKRYGSKVTPDAIRADIEALL